MNGRRLFRKYAQSIGHEAKEFVRIDKDYYYKNIFLITKDNNGNEEKTYLDYEKMIYWIIKNIKTDSI